MKQIYKNVLLVFLFLGSVSMINAQSVSVSGTVKDASGPLPGVSILIKGTTSGTETNFDGEYKINAKKGDVLVFRYLGYKKAERTVGNSNTINLSMEQDSSTLDEVIVVAYGTSTKEALTGAVDVIGAKDLELRAVTSPIAAIEGKATGVQFLSASGQPGSSPGIVIRGVGTLNGTTTPLYIVDGVPFQGSLSLLNQEDIASLTVLKDAAATSLYGSRASNGVVIVTTKSGKSGKLQVNVSTQFGVINRAIDDYETVNAGQYYELAWEGYKNSSAVNGDVNVASATIFNRLGYNPFDVPNDQIVGTDGKLNPNANLIYESLDWRSILERTGTRENHSMSISGGGENHKVFFSSSYLKEEGYVIESDFERITTRLNADFTPTKWLKVGGNLSIALTDSHGPSSGGTGSIVNPFNWALNLAPIYPVYEVDTNGKIVRDASGEPVYDLGETKSRPYNPGRHGIAELILNEEQRLLNNMSFRNFAEFTIMDGLKVNLTYSREIQDRIEKEYENEVVGDGNPFGRYQEERYRRTVENFTQTIKYNKTFNDVHNLDLLGGHESYRRDYSELNGIANTQTATGIYEFANFSAGDNVNGFSTAHRIESYFAQLGYNYDSKYYLTASFRSDGTSRFSADKRWGNFYSVGASWRIDQEKFMEDVTFIDNLKLRASYGEVGNENVGNFFLYQALYGILPNAGAPGLFWSDPGNSDLIWENQASWNVALEFGLFDNLIDGSVEYYKKSSVDLLFNQPIPLTEGQNQAPFNIGDMFNSGIEASLTGHIFKTENFDWDLTLQASTLNNEITRLIAPADSGSKRWEEGRSRYDYYIYHWAGVDPANGDSLYLMFEDDLTTGQRVPVLDANGVQMTTNDFQAAGEAFTGDSSIPDLIGSISNSFRYKQFSLDFLITFSVGGKILDNGYSSLMHPGTYGRNLHVDALNAWRQPGDITNIPRLETGAPNQTVGGSTRFLTDASFVTLRNVNLGYRLDSDLADKLGLNSMRFFVSGENLFISAARKGVNPQQGLSGVQGGNSFQPASVVSLGLNVSF
ncbi:MAG: SusC/RagA family TonB-linked outer membrane protein [Polaribacter sp.]